MSTVIKLKPMGAVAVVAAIGFLGIMAFRNSNATQDVPKNNDRVEGSVTSPWSVKPSGSSDGYVPNAGWEVYGDNLVNQWEQIGWAKEITMNEPRFTHSGRTAIRVDYKPFEGVKFYHPSFKTNDYDRVSFYVLGSGKGGQKLSVSTTRLSIDVTKQSVVTKETLPGGRWMCIVVPLKQIGVEKVPDMTSFWIQEATGQKTTIFIDDVRLLRPSDPDPSGPTLSIENASAP